MIKSIINFFDQHRILLVISILFFIVIIFIGINSYLFFHHQFSPLTCTQSIDDEYCYYEDTIIFKNPENSKNAFFKQYNTEILELQETYNLAEFNFYTAYYYLVASRLNTQVTGEDEILENFFQEYTDTYNIEAFYFKNIFYFELFYPYKIY